jgi:HlyD family secretion protein
MGRTQESEEWKLKIREKNIKTFSMQKLEKLAAAIENSNAAGLFGIIIGKVPVLKTLNKLSLKKRRVVYSSVLLLITAAAAVTASGYFNTDKGSVTYTEYTVKKGNVTVAISGDGTVEPIEQYSVVSLVEGDVLADTFKEGDSVTKGALLYKIDSSDMEKTLEKANISYEKSQMNYQDSLDSYQGLTVTAPISGRVTEIKAKKGDNVSSGSEVATIVNDTYLTAKVPFSTSDAGSLHVGESVDVTVAGTFEKLTGTISKINKSKRVLDGYIEVTDVEISVKNPGALGSGTYVTVNADGIDSYESAELEGNIEKIVTAKTSGLVSKVIASEGEYLSSGDAILHLTNDSADNDLKSSQLSLRESELSYESSQDQLDEYSVTAPISGTVIEKDVKAGDTVEKSSSGSGSSALCVIADMSVMTLAINVDELDIAQMKEGQEVSITADALAGKTFTGYVDNIGILGTSSDGVTSYPVKIVINNADGLWPGMNVSAKIAVNSASNVLRVPVSALNRGNTVLVKGAKGSRGAAQKNAPDGAQYVKVSVGLNDESYIEVTKGLSKGDVVLVPVIRNSGEKSTKQQMMPAGGMQEPRSNGGSGSGYGSGSGRSRGM